MKVVVITSSGALSPGPLTFSILKKGTEEGARAGFFASLGHMVVELPLVYLIGLGVITFLFNDFVMFITGIVGGVFILLFGVLTMQNPSIHALYTFPLCPLIPHKRMLLL